jgi:hypothetical protein
VAFSYVNQLADTCFAVVIVLHLNMFSTGISGIRSAEWLCMGHLLQLSPAILKRPKAMELYSFAFSFMGRGCFKSSIYE